MLEATDGTMYRCVAGHSIPAAELPVRTEVRTLDHGAEVRVCREHGAPIATFRPSPSPGAGARPRADASP